MSGNSKKQSQIIRESHERSVGYGVERDRKFPARILSKEAMDECLKRNEHWLQVADMYLNELFTFVKGSGYMMILTDSKGCILRLWGDDVILKEAAKLSMSVGALMDERSVGTNAMGTAIKENAPIQVTAKEHFIGAYHRWTCSAAPFHDVEGALIGTVNLTGNSELVHPHTLGLVVAAVKAIENHLQNNLVQKQLFDSNMYAFAMMNNLSYGVFAVDLNEDIHWVNDTACNTLNIRRLLLLNQPINKFFKEWNQARKSVLSGKSFKDEEGHFLLRELKDEKFLFNAYSIKTAEQEILGYLITFREYSSMLKLVNKYTGSQARYTFDNIIGQSKVIKETLRNAKTIADSPSTVLITGDSGTGKEVFAQAIHNASSRRDAGFVALNCGAISPSLIESELFGYDDGAFTGAKKGGNPGKFELANNGTLFLDEIGEMPMDMQVRLLRAIQEGSVQRIGSDKTTRVDVRIIAATNKNLEEEVKQGRFRLDLFYRLNVIPIRVPSLSERKEDLWTLLKYFLKHKAAKLRMPVPDIEIELLDRVMAYHWPGNVRELENFAEKLVILEGKLSLEMMDTEFRNILETIRPVKVVSPSAMMYEREIMTLDEMERRAISNAVNQLNGNMTLVAKRLGISRNTLYLKMKKYNLAIPEKSGSRT